DFRRIPVLARRTYQEQFADFRSRALPPGTVPMGEDVSSGTSGMPVTALKTNVTNLWWYAFYLRDLRWCDMDPRGTLAAIRLLTGKSADERRRLLEGASLPCWSPALRPLIASGPSHGMDIHQHPRRQLEWLQRIRPDYLMSYPSNLEHLAGLVRE